MESSDARADRSSDDDRVFRALADPTRRVILDALFTADGETVGQLADRFPDMSRFGVMKHLRVLEDADLLISRRVGRSKHHHLNPVPLHAIASRWLHKYSLPVTGAMLALRRDLEGSAAGPSARQPTGQSTKRPAAAPSGRTESSS